MTTPKFRNGYNYDRNKASTDSGLHCRDASRAVQSQKKETDINTIVRNFGITGQVPITKRPAFPYDLDFDQVGDFQAMQDALLQARRSFASLPSAVRSRFSNNAVAFADFASDPANLETLREWGLAPPASKPAPEPSPGA